MKKRIVVLFAGLMALAGASSFAAEADAGAKAPAVSASAVAPRAPGRAQITPEQRAEMRAKREKFMAERKAAMQARMLEVVKKYVSDEEKAKALVAELEVAMKPSRRAPAKKPAAKKAE